MKMYNAPTVYFMVKTLLQEKMCTNLQDRCDYALLLQLTIPETSSALECLSSEPPLKSKLLFPLWEKEVGLWLHEQVN